MRGGGLKAAAAGGLSGALAGGLEGTKGLGAGAHQFRNQSNEMARALTGDPKIETGIRGAVKGFVKSSSNANLIRAQQKYDLNWQRKSAEQQRKAGYTSHVMGFHNNGKSLETNITHPNGMKVKLNDGDSYIAFESKSGEFEKFNVEASAVGKVLGTTDVSVIERAMTNQDSRYYNEEFAKLVSKRDKYSARLNAQEARNQAKADKDFNKRLATMLEERGYKKEK